MEVWKSAAAVFHSDFERQVVGRMEFESFDFRKLESCTTNTREKKNSDEHKDVAFPLFR
jgi:hypothetical protein